MIYLFLAALIPLIVGMIWYNKAIFGTAWMKASGLTPEQLKGGNMVLLFILTYFFSLLIASSLMPIVIHQMGVMSVLANEPGINDPNSPMGKYIADFMSKYGHNFRTFKHGAFHGTLTAIFFATPLIGISAIYEKRGFKYIAINAGYWIICLALMGGVVCQFV